jgi:tetratricopeptide (TPR) repeat protein
MAREKPPLIRPPTPLWVKAAWTAAAALIALFIWMKTRPPAAPACDAEVVKSDLGDLVNAAASETLETRAFRTVTETKELKTCAAVAMRQDVEIPIEYSVTIEGRAPKVEITSGEDRLAPPEAEAPADAGKQAAAGGENCQPGAEAEKRIADCGKIIDDKDRPAEARAEALTLRGQAYSEGKDWDPALADLTAAIALHSKDGAGSAGLSSIYLARAAAYLGKGDHKDALADFSAAIRTDASNGAALLGRACEWAAAGSLANAEADLKRAAALTKDQPDAPCSAAIDALRVKAAQPAKTAQPAKPAKHKK